MKTLKKSAIVLGLFGLLVGTTTLVRAQDYQNDYQDDGYNAGNVSMQTFYDELTPYGTWIQDPQYGYVWRPDVDQNEFRPYYTNGRWAMTEYGNTWVSNYDWGWAPFHYGRWVINNYRQWIWLPDTNWGPAWVDWRSGDGYYGWAPMAPSININLSFGRRYSVPEFCWNFIPQRNIYINTFPRYDYGRNNVYIRNTTIINNTYVYNRRSYYGGPRMEDIRRATNRDVTVYRYAQSNRPGASRDGGREVSIYRPRPERNAVDNRNAAPRKFEQANAGISRGGRNDANATRNQRGRDNNPNRGNTDQRGTNDNRFGSRNDNRNGQSNRGNDATVGRDNNQANNRGEAYDRNANGRTSRGSTNGIEQRNAGGNVNSGQDQQRSEQIRQQRTQQDRMSQDQQRAQREVRGNDERLQQIQRQRTEQAAKQNSQRNEQAQQQRSQQMEQQRAQRNEQAQQQRSQQMEQQRAQRDQQAQQQRSQQMEQQRAQRDQQAQQQRSQQMEQQRAQRDAQQQQQRAQQQRQMQQRQEQRRTESAPPQQRGGSERSGSEGGRPSRGGRG